MSCNLCEQRWMHGLDGECSQCVARRRIAELEAEVERLRADGERLDWLEANQINLEIFDLFGKPREWYVTGGEWKPTLRAAIDAARKEQA